jgi:hypothetical protein
MMYPFEPREGLMDTARARLLAEEICDFDARFQALATGTNKEDDPDSLLDDLRVSAVELATLVASDHDQTGVSP